MVIFDKAWDSNMLYTNPKYDVSDRVIKELGYTPENWSEEKKKGGWRRARAFRPMNDTRQGQGHQRT